MATTPDQLDAAALAFLDERHLATLSTHRSDGTIHAVPVAFSYVADEHTVRIVAPDGTVKVSNADNGSDGVLCFVDGGRWMTLSGSLDVRREPERVDDTLTRYEQRYGPPHGDRSALVSLELTVRSVMGRWILPQR